MLLADETALDAICLVADYRMPDCDGIDTLGQLRAKGWSGPSVLMTGFPSAKVADIARTAGFEMIVEKPQRPHALVRLVEQLTHQAGG